MNNPYGLVLDAASLRWAAAESVPETVIAAICLLETRSVDEIVVRLTPAELEQVIKIVGRCPRGYPPGAYEALKGHRRTLSPKPQPAERINHGTERSHWRAEQTEGATKPTQPWTPPHRSATAGATTNPYGFTLDRAWPDWAAQHGVSETMAAAPAGFRRAEVPQRATEHATPTNPEKPGTLPGTLVETVRRRMVVDDLMGAGLSVRTISAGTGIPRSSVHRAMRAIARAEAKRQVAIVEIAKALL